MENHVCPKAVGLTLGESRVIRCDKDAAVGSVAEPLIRHEDTSGIAHVVSEIRTDQWRTRR